MLLHLWGDETQLAERLARLGLSQTPVVELHENRTVMVSLNPQGVLRLHRGYVYAPDQVLAAIVAFLKSKRRGAQRSRALQEILAFPVDRYVPGRPRTMRRPERPRPGDADVVRELKRRHARLNRTHFDGSLSNIRFRVSGRMRSRLGEVLLDSKSLKPAEIAISRRHVRRDGWDAVQDTLLHEMVHQWQGEQGLPVDHGKTFREKARDVGVEPFAVRRVEGGKAARRG